MCIDARYYFPGLLGSAQPLIHPWPRRHTLSCLYKALAARRGVGSIGLRQTTHDHLSHPLRAAWPSTRAKRAQEQAWPSTRPRSPRTPRARRHAQQETEEASEQGQVTSWLQKKVRAGADYEKLRAHGNKRNGRSSPKMRGKRRGARNGTPCRTVPVLGGVRRAAPRRTGRSAPGTRRSAPSRGPLRGSTICGWSTIYSGLSARSGGAVLI